MGDSLGAGNLIPSPLYKEVLVRITRNLAEGEWRPGDALPSETRLSQRYNVSIGTLRKAIDELVSAKILHRQQGRGTFVATHNQDRSLYYFFHIVAKDGVKRYAESALISFTRIRESGEAAKLLDIDRGAAPFRIVNLLKLEQRPVVLDEVVIPGTLFPGLTRAIFEQRENTIYGLYQSRFHINVLHTVERLRARTADAKTARTLDIKSGEPVLEIQRVVYTYDDQPVELRISRVNTREHDYLNDLV